MSSAAIKIVAQYKFQHKKGQEVSASVCLKRCISGDYIQGVMDRTVSSDHDCDEFFPPIVMG